MVHAFVSVLAAAEESEPDKTLFYVLGPLLPLWAVVLSVVGITQPDFPRTQQLARLVMGISALLVVGVLTLAVATS